ncbi:MAG TPA: hypothetical protein VMV92_44420 [Streptosporangiaceae bacterium]|nr:hypothetical protein [Streptosporangiaceae bacterium]HVB44858.1 hypothetical protein [Streptosporangiaceae bacterium]
MRTALAVLLAALALAACGRQAPAASARSQPHPAVTVKCGLIKCSHGRVGQPCSIAGYPGIIVQVSATALGCDPKPGSFQSQPAASPSSAPAPVSTAATVTGTCVMGYEWTPNSTNAASGTFVAGPPAAETSNGDSALAYQVTLTNSSGSTADVGGFAVAFYSGGTEVGSDQEQATGLITQGQSLSWTVIEDQTVHGYGDDPDQALAQTGSIPASGTTCSFVQWSAP